MIDDDRIERALRAGPADEPAYVRVGRLLDARPSARRAAGFGSRIQAVMAVVLVVVVVAAIAIIRAGPPATRDSVGGDLLSDVRTLGRIRIAVTSGSPQVEIQGVGYQGFDVDVARAIGERIGLRVEIDLVNPAEIAAGHWEGRWDVAIDSGVATEQRRTVLETGAAYYRREALAIVRESSGLRELTNLDGAKICVLQGSLAESWLAGRLRLVGGESRPAPRAGSVTTGSIDECLGAVRGGAVDAFVADWSYDVGSVPAGLVALAEAPFVGLAAPSVDWDRPGSTHLLAEVDRVLAALQADGTLRGLSQRRFGGADLTMSPGG